MFIFIELWTLIYVIFLSFYFFRRFLRALTTSWFNEKWSYQDNSDSINNIVSYLRSVICAYAGISLLVLEGDSRMRTNDNNS
ncbi:MAG: hypothetical protein NT007_07150 [Candidatus Kapabacteria bacterium]|nr:hypothetical protein [Candidatus Kapabacteria bacterium]